MDPLPIKPRRKRKLDPKVIRKGDRIRILTSRMVHRVGYPKTVPDYYGEVEEHLGLQIDKFLNLRAPFAGWGLVDKQPSWRRGIISALAYAKAKEDGFGGKQRSLYFMYEPKYEGKVFTVAGVRTVQTGIYNGPIDDCGFGGLADMKSYRLVEIYSHDIRPYQKRGPEFLLTEVKKIMPGEDENQKPVNKPADPEEELRILKEAYEYWISEDATDEEAQESGAEDAEEMATWCLDELREKGVEVCTDCRRIVTTDKVGCSGCD